MDLSDDPTHPPVLEEGVALVLLPEEEVEHGVVPLAGRVPQGHPPVLSLVLGTIANKKMSP